MRGLFLLAFLAAPAAAYAQQWKLGVDGGRIRSTIDPLASASGSVAAGLGYESVATAFRISTGMPTQNGSPYWGAVGGWRRLSASKAEFIGGIDLSGSGFAFAARQRVTTNRPGGLVDRITTSTVTTSGRAIAGQAAPLVGLEMERVQLHARAGLSVYSASTQGQDDRNRAVRFGDIQLTLQPTPSLAVMPVVRRFEPRQEPATTFAGASTVVARGRASAWGSAGRWVSGPDSVMHGTPSWSVGGQLGLTPSMSINAVARHESFDPLYLSPSQTSWSVGLSFLLSGRPPRAPVPAAYEKGVATIRLPASASRVQPRVAGDFNKWTPALMERDGEFWTYRVPAQPGVYNYSFVAPDGTWYVPQSVPGRKDDGMGGHVAVLVIR